MIISEMILLMIIVFMMTGRRITCQDGGLVKGESKKYLALFRYNLGI
jgi:hypothetical protein